MLIRNLSVHERGLYAGHLKRLSERDRRLRFAGPGVSDGRIDTYVAGIRDTDPILVAEAEGRVVGGAHVAINGEVAEVGISVDAGHRDDGLGTELLAQAVAFARNRRAGKLYTLCLSDNRGMISLARRSGMELRCLAGEAEAFLDLPPPDPLTVSEEVRAGLFALFHDWAEVVDAYGEALSKTLVPLPLQPSGE